MNFKEYLREKNLAPRTIETQWSHLKTFQRWAEKQGITSKKANYQDLLQYIRSQQSKNIQPRTINQRLRSIEQYFRWQGRNPNPAHGLRIKTKNRQQTKNLLTTQELEQIYHAYIERPLPGNKPKLAPLVHKRNLVLLSLLIYQGLHSGEIGKLEVSHLHLKAGKIYVPSGPRHNSRYLQFKGPQVLLIQEYFQNIRPKLLDWKNLETEKLFDIRKNAYNLVNRLIGQLKKLTPLVKNAYQIRRSVITGWLEQYSIREVQYMAGHRYISSTQEYEQVDIEDLQQQIDRYHPLR